MRAVGRGVCKRAWVLDGGAGRLIEMVNYLGLVDWLLSLARTSSCTFTFLSSKTPFTSTIPLSLHQSNIFLSNLQHTFSSRTSSFLLFYFLYLSSFSLTLSLSLSFLVCFLFLSTFFLLSISPSFPLPLSPHPLPYDHNNPKKTKPDTITEVQVATVIQPFPKSPFSTMVLWSSD